MNLKHALLSLALLAGFSSTAASQDFPESLYTLPIQDAGRVKPLDTVARNTIRVLSSHEKIDGRPSLEVFLRIVFEPQESRAEKIVRIDHPKLKTFLGLDPEEKLFTWAQLPANERVFKLGIEQKLNSHDPHDKAFEEAFSQLYEKYQLRSRVEGGVGLDLVPDPRGAEYPWVTRDRLQGHADEAISKANDAWGAMRKAFVDRDLVELDAATRKFRNATTVMAKGGYPAQVDLDRELRYNRLMPFRWSWILYLCGFIAFAIGLALTKSKWLTVAGFAALGAGFVMHSYGFYLRTVILDRVPVSNMWESIIFVGWCTVVAALFVEARWRLRWVACLAALAGTGAMLVADLLPLAGSEMGMLNAVLRSNFWLTTHVLTIVASYGFFFLSAVLAHASLGTQMFRPKRWALIQTMDRVNYGFLRVGVLLLIAGTLLGGMWANESWGRFWGWDPKETWSAISCVVYLALMHARRSGWLREFGMATSSILAFVSVIMTWYGVNYVLGSGLHSYGGQGTSGAFWFFAYVIIELAYVGVGMFVHKRRQLVAQMAKSFGPQGSGASAH